ncbi:DEAD/DEAH box helicase [Polymorphum gilvum]|uniref:DEAD-box ATP-dependent RNA helicase RhpA n=1 Tax=Polymorphum gilvum (strain LMG 25793 / CGMCC 1.9160 / SL003B-26A1) TaxID=991905 RepID=F2J0U4_POLGS|nr:DEAD/DEAH box helicase [Polymorphum gilvum]ADZ70780.1 DEAD/DEAH box helicase domain protein [Polymorphum gilvum SL003B-26A1]
MSFDSLGLSEKVLSAVKAAGYTEPTAIQAGAIPQVLERRDVLGIAQTGTGKTASFTLPMLTLLEKGRARARMPRTLILEPTRELAAQVEENFEKYGVNHKLNVALLIGGVSFADQDRKIDRGADVLIATPGRLLDHVERGKLMLQGVEILVIDEADRMLDMGFIPDIERICKLIPFTRQTLFFSATMPPEIQRLTETFLQNPAKIEVAPRSSTAENVTQYIVAAGSVDFEKRAKLRELLGEAEDLKNAIVFCNRKRDVTTLFRSLERHGFNVGCLHGDMDQRTRMQTLESFRKGTLTLLVASDVAARGLDIPDVSHVFNFDVPIHAEDYVHRIGRTGRAGRSGVSYTLVTGEDSKYLSAIEKLINKSITWLGEPLDFEAAEAERKERRRAGKGTGRTARGGAEKREPGEKPQKSRAGEPRRALDKDEGGAPKRERTRASSARDAKPARDRSEPRRDRSHETDEPVIGLGSHVPAFLLREPRPKGAS